MNFNEQQMEAIKFGDGACSVIATAGSGKTEVLTRRIENLIKTHGVSSDEILALTFSNKAAREMEYRVNKYVPDSNVHICTFHSFGNSIIRQWGKKYELLDYDYKKSAVFVDACKRRLLDAEDKKAFYLDYISRQKHHLRFPNRTSMDNFEVAYALYESKKESDGKMDFDDMIVKAYQILNRNKEALKYYQNKYKYILADEMQDTNTAEYEILKLIAGNRKNVFIVSDPLQNIYEWLGTDNKYVLEFDKDWSNATVINLYRNYRSSNNIVTYANNFARGMDETRSHFYVEAKADKPDGKNIEYHLYENEYNESKSVVDKIKELKTKYNYKDIAIIARTNAQLMFYESILSEEKIPYLIYGSTQFTEREEIKTVINYLKLIQNGNNADALEYVANRPSRYIKKKIIQDARNAVGNSFNDLIDIMLLYVGASQEKKLLELKYTLSIARKMEYKNVGEVIRFIRNEFLLDEYFQKKENTTDGETNSRIDNLDTLESIAEKFETIGDFLKSMNSVDKNDEKSDYVNLLTIHKAKGLEFSVVFLIGVNEGVLPHKKNPRLNEEKRLYYVAITRPKDELYISSTFNFMGKPSIPSEFVGLEAKGGIRKEDDDT